MLAALGAAQLSMQRPPWLIKYGTVFVWVALFAFLFVCSDRTAWPLGKIGWLESFRDPETAGHRLGVGLLLVIATGDALRVRKGWKANPALSRWGMLTLGLAGSTMLFQHFHRTIDPAHYALATRMNAQHFAMASCALAFTLSKFAWDTWRVPRKGGQYVCLAFLALLGVVLVLYVE